MNNLYSTNFFEDVKIKLNNNILEIQVKEYPVINQIFLVGEQRTALKNKFKTLSLNKKIFYKIILSKGYRKDQKFIFINRVQLCKSRDKD